MGKLTSEQEKQLKKLLVDDFKNRFEKLDLTTVTAYLDVIKFRKNKTQVKNVYEVIPKRFYFHVDTGWIIEFVPGFRESYNKFKTKCFKIYVKNFISILVTRSKPQTVAKNFQKWKKKLGYRLILCLRKENHEKTHLLSIARHISVPPKNVKSTKSKYAITKSRIIARAENKTYPDIYRLDKLLLNYIVSDDIKYLIMIKKLMESGKYVYKP